MNQKFVFWNLLLFASCLAAFVSLLTTGTGLSRYLPVLLAWPLALAVQSGLFGLAWLIAVRHIKLRALVIALYCLTMPFSVVFSYVMLQSEFTSAIRPQEAQRRLFDDLRFDCGSKPLFVATDARASVRLPDGQRTGGDTVAGCGKRRAICRLPAGGLGLSSADEVSRGRVERSADGGRRSSVGVLAPRRWAVSEALYAWCSARARPGSSRTSRKRVHASRLIALHPSKNCWYPTARFCHASDTHRRS